MWTAGHEGDEVVLLAWNDITRVQVFLYCKMILRDLFYYAAHTQTQKKKLHYIQVIPPYYKIKQSWFSLQFIRYIKMLYVFRFTTKWNVKKLA